MALFVCTVNPNEHHKENTIIYSELIILKTNALTVVFHIVTCTWGREVVRSSAYNK